MSVDKCPGCGETQCPFCGADEEMRFGLEGIYYKCGTSHWGNQDVRITGVRQWRCYKSENEQLKGDLAILTVIAERIEEMERLLKAATEVIDGMGYVDRYHSLVDFDVEELLGELKKFTRSSDGTP